MILESLGRWLAGVNPCEMLATDARDACTEAKGERSVEKEMRTDGSGECTGGYGGRSAGKGTPTGAIGTRTAGKDLCTRQKEMLAGTKVMCAGGKETRTAGIGARVYRKYTGAEGETPYSEVPALLPQLFYLKERPPWWL